MSGPRGADHPPKRARAIHCERICDRFEAAWSTVCTGGQRPCLDDFLAEANEPEREMLLRELVQVEVDYRRQLGERPTCDDFGLRHTELSVDWLNELLCEPATLPFEETRTTPPTMTGRRFGDYQLLQEIARGGMGVVYKARQVSLNRIVALKMILAGSQASDADILRFRAEAEAAANLDDPGIVPIYEVGQHAGQYFFSMGYVDGKSLAARLAEGPFPPREAAEIVRDVARAVHYAHQAGVIHRDLKPANILIDTTNRPRVTDFGLAKRTANDSSLTASGQVLGTPSYMPPEQAAGKVDQVGPQADVYALGAVLYAALTGRPPFQAATPAATLQLVLDQDPVPVSQFNRAVARDLETISLKCLEKSPQRRYSSAAELADDLDRWLTGQTILACRSSAWERALKWVRRRPAVAGLSVVLAAVTVIAFVLVTSLWMSALRFGKKAELAATAAKADAQAADDARKTAENERKKAQRLAARLALDNAQTLCERGDVNRGLLFFDYTLDLLPSDDEGARYAVRANLAAWQQQVVPLQDLLPHPDLVESQTFSPDGRLLLTVCRDHNVRVWDTVTGELFVEPLPHPKAVRVAAFDASSKKIVTGTDDGYARLWDITNQQVTCQELKHDAPVTTAMFSRGGEVLITGDENGSLQSWEPSTGRPRRRNKASGPILVAALSPDHQVLATGAGGGQVQLWMADSLEPAAVQLADPEIMTVKSKAWAVQFAAGGERLLAVVHDDEDEKRLGVVYLWDTRSGQLVDKLTNRWEIGAITISADGKRVLTGGGDNTAQLWDALSARPLPQPPLQHQAAVVAVAFSPDEKTLLTGSRDRTVRLWDAATGLQLFAPMEHPGAVQSVAFSPDGRTFSTFSKDTAVRLWSIPQRSEVTIKANVKLMALAVSPDGERVAAGDSRGQLRIYQTSDATLLSPPLDAHPESEIWAVAFSPNGKWIATGGRNGTAKLWDLDSFTLVAKLEHKYRLRSLAFSPDSNLLLTGTGSRDGGIAGMWDLPGGKQFAPLHTTNEAWAVAFSPSGSATLCAVASGENEVWLWRRLPPLLDRAELVGTRGVPDGDAFKLAPLHRDRVVALAYSPDGKWLATGSADHTARLWDAVTGAPRGEAITLPSTIWGVVFSADGRFLITGCQDNSIRVWDVATGAPVGPIWRQQGAVWGVACDPLRPAVWSVSDDGSVRQWPLTIPWEGSREMIRSRTQVLSGMEFGSHQTARWLDAAKWQSQRDELDLRRQHKLPK